MKHPRTTPAKTARFVYPTTPPYRIRFVRHRRDLGFQHCPQYQLQHFPVASGGRGQQTTSSSSDRHPGQQQIRFAAKATRTREKNTREEHEKDHERRHRGETTKKNRPQKGRDRKTCEQNKRSSKRLCCGRRMQKNAEECRRMQKNAEDTTYLLPTPLDATEQKARSMAGVVDMLSNARNATSWSSW